MRFLLALAGSLLSAVLLFLAYPGKDWGLLAWVGLVPLFLVLPGVRSMQGFLASFIGGFAYFSGVLIWVYHIPGFQPIHHLLVGIYLSPFFGFFGLAYVVMVRRRSPFAALAAAPFIWVSLEFLRTNMSFLSLPWGFLSHTQYLFPPVIQISSLAGAYGVTFLIVAVNAAIAGTLYHLFHPDVISRRSCAALCLASFSLLAVSVLYGLSVLSTNPGEEGLTVAVLQGNIGSEMKRNPREFAEPIMTAYVELTKETARNHPDLIVWPEAATPGLILKQPRLLSLTTKAISGAGSYFVIGSSEYPKFSKESVQGRRKGNTALFFSPEGKVLGQYLKIHLVPFGEEIPYENIIPWPRFIVSDRDANWDLPGKEHTLFEIDGRKFGVVICWEQVFPGLFRTFVRKGANFMLNLTNEGWFGDSSAPYQMLAISVFRAAENRVPLARAANTGVSGFIDRFGRIGGLLGEGGRETFVRGHLMREIRPASKRTFYTRYGDVFALSSAAVSAFLFFMIFRKKSKGDSAGAIRL